MGVFGKLFGKGGEGTPGQARCNECGMTAGSHTDWCPLVAAEGEGEARGVGGRKGPTPPESPRGARS